MKARLIPILVLMVVGCKEKGDPSEPLNEVPPTLTVSERNITADGVSTTVVSIEKGSGREREVVLGTTSGVFVPSNTSSVALPLSDNAPSIAILRSPTSEGKAYIVASVGKDLLRDSVTFTRAHPEAIRIESDKFAVAAKPTEEARITVQLSRLSGSLQSGTQIEMNARNNDGVTVGRFSTIPIADANGTASVRYTPGNTSYRGPVTITAAVTTPNRTISSATVVDVIDPPADSTSNRN